MKVLDQPVLILNKSWVPITILPAGRAISLLFTNKAKAIDPEDYSTYDFESWADLGKIFEGKDFIRTPNLKIPIPDVVVLSDYNKHKPRAAPFSRKNLLIRDNYQCQYCSKRVSTKTFTIDHVIPRARKGKTCFENCVVSCLRCNLRKGSKLLSECGMKLLKKPTVPKCRITYGVPLHNKKITWDKFIKDKALRDEVASMVYWNAALKD